MSNFTYSKSSGMNDPFFGKFEHPIKMIIEKESNKWEKQGSVLDLLFNVEKSSRYAETIMGESDFEDFQAKGEGQRGENDTVQKTFDKTIEHVSFSKEFTITREMADDAKTGVASNIRQKPKKMVQSYYRTRIKLAIAALINGTSSSMLFNKARVDLTVGDKLPLFSGAHKYALPKFKNKTQTNYYYGDLTKSTAAFEEALAVAVNNMRNVEDENGETMDYTADILIIPSNRPKFEKIAKQVIGSERTAGTNDNDINTQFGNWTLVVLPGWRTPDDRFMIMSSEANESLLANMFYNRVQLDIRYGIDDHTRDMYWNGYCRFGVGFTTWKHIALYVNSTDAVTGATEVELSTDAA